MKTLLMLLASVVATTGSIAQLHYVHRKLDWFTDTPWVSLMGSGRILYGGTKDDPELPRNQRTYDLYVDGVNYTADLFAGWHQVTGGSYQPDGNLWFYAHYADAEGRGRSHLFRNKTNYVAENWGMEYSATYYRVNSRGDVAIMLYLDPSDGYDLWLNTVNVSCGVLGGPDHYRFAAPVTLLDTGGLFWIGMGQTTQYQDDLFLDETNLSAAILGTNRRAAWLVANSSDDYVWQGGGANTQGYQNIFKGTQNFGARVFGSVRYEARLHGYSKNGHIAWSGLDQDPVGGWGVYRDETNLSTMLGEGREVDYFAGISSDGRVWWRGKGAATGGMYDIFIDEANLSGPILGWDPSRLTAMQGFTSAGRVLWLGYVSGAGYNYYLDDVNVTAGAFEGVPGRRWVSNMGAVANARGDVLWIARNSYREWEVWYSELVPEPGSMLLLLPGLFVAMWRKGRRAS